MAAGKALRLQNIKEKLEFLGCPYVENVEETWLTELLFKPGEPRLRLVQWLLARFDPSIEELLDSHQARVSNLTDSRVGRLLFCSNLLGLCHNDDVDLITGSSSKSKQLAFFEDLIDMISIVDEVDNPLRPTDIVSTPKWKEQPRTLNNDFAGGCQYLDLLCQQEDLADIFKEKIQLFPPDIEKQFGTTMDSSGTKRSHVPDVTHLSSMASQIGLDLEKQNKILERFQSNSSTAYDPQTLDKISRTMSLTMSTLSQMVEAFTHCYETEMKPWSGREKPQLSQLGPVFKRVSLLLEKFLQILTSLEKLKTSHIQISSLKTLRIDNNLVPLGKLALSNLQDCISILDEAFKRKMDSFNDTESL